MAKKKVGEDVENTPPEKKIKGIARISAGYSRKVNLKSISTQFDNIDQSFHASCIISFESPEEFKRKSEILSNAVRDITEKEVGKTISKLFEMKEDTSNNALLGLGVNIEHKKFLDDEIGDISQFLMEEDINETIKSFADLEEVDLTTVEM
jgi:hypothetical protein